MKPVFADAGHWIALNSPLDGLHQRAVTSAQNLGSRTIVTSQMVLTEVLDGTASRGQAIREQTVRFTRLLASLPNVRIIPQTPELFEAALTLYAQRPDKQWSLTDCASFVICRQEGITDVLTHDHHFVQMGLNAMLRDPSS